MTAWTPNAHVTLTNSNLTASFNVDAGVYRGCIGTAGKTSGKYHYEGTIVATSGGFHLFGFCNSSIDVTTSPIIGDANSAAIQFDLGTGLAYYYNAALIDEWNCAVVQGHVIAIEIDIGNSLVWFQDATLATGWSRFGSSLFTGDPTDSVSGGGTSFSGINQTGGIFPGVWGAYVSSNPETLTLNPGVVTSGVAFTAPVSTGYVAWDASAGIPVWLFRS